VQNHIDRLRSGQQFTAPTARILVVDDNRMNLTVVCELLKKTEIKVDTAKSGAECLELADRNHYDLILMDHMMPEMDGVETLISLRGQLQNHETPVIALTANAVAGAREMYLDYGFDDYLSKPISGDKLERKLLRYLPQEKLAGVDQPMEPAWSRENAASEQAGNSDKQIWHTGGTDARDSITHIFIVNPFAGQHTFAADLRKKLARIDGLRYFIFNTKEKGSETEMVKNILLTFENERLRFYCCGGSGTLRNVLNGFPDLSRVEIAFLPCGISNDFLKVFGESEQDFSDIEKLVDGEVMDIDYIRSNCGVMLNTFSTGMDAAVVTKMEEYRLLNSFNRYIPYTLASAYAVLFARQYSYDITLDGRTVTGEMAEVFFGNGQILGGNLAFAKSVDIEDGKGDYRLIHGVKGLRALHVMHDFQKQYYNWVDERSEFGRCREITIRRTDGKPFSVNQDGESIGNLTEWKAKIVHRGLHFVVPKGVKQQYEQ
jgi:CheY-like chemotaxis protein/diacylglycerol kinase family enzyme